MFHVNTSELVQVIDYDTQNVYCQSDVSVFAINHQTGKHVWTTPIRTGRGLFFVKQLQNTVVVLTASPNDEAVVISLSKEDGSVKHTMQLPDWPARKGLGEHVNKLLYVIQRTRAASDIGLWNPTTGEEQHEQIDGGYEYLSNTTHSTCAIGHAGALSIEQQLNISPLWQKHRVNAAYETDNSWILWRKDRSSHEPALIHIPTQAHSAHRIVTSTTWNPSTRPLTLKDEVLYVTNKTGAIISQSIHDGSVHWCHTPKQAQNVSAIHVLKDTILVHAIDLERFSTDVYALNPKTGDKIKAHPWIPSWPVEHMISTKTLLAFCGLENMNYTFPRHSHTDQ